jgi:signal transduction histidine kinase
VILERRGDDVTLIVEDDGRGFDVEAARAARGAGMGLVGMHERAASLGGQLQYESAPGHGTTLFVRIPITVPTPSP